jgi:putative transposase
VAPHETIPIKRQCDLLGLPRSSYYFAPAPAVASDQELALLRLVDEIYTGRPVYGQRRLAAVLRREHGLQVGRQRLRRAMETLGLEAVRPRPNTSKPAPGHRIYPYLLRGVAVSEPGVVWATDLTYIRLARGFLYLVVHLDWHSRFVLSWRLGTTMESALCLESLEDALSHHPAPQIHNSDQGSQFTAESYVQRVLDAGVKVSMDGRGRWADNVFVERLWRTVKYEYVFLQQYETVWQMEAGLRDFFAYYNERRPHQSLGYATPGEVFRGEVQVAPATRKPPRYTPQQRARADPPRETALVSTV